jgi:hypothetical protein
MTLTNGSRVVVANLPRSDHVVRHVPWARLRRNEHDEVIGILPHAFQRREAEDALSVNWLEHAEGTRDEQVEIAAKRIAATLRLGGKSRLALSLIGKIHSTCLKHGAKVRIVHEPLPKNPGHASIRQLPREDLILLEALANEANLYPVPCGELTNG